MPPQGPRVPSVTALPFPHQALPSAGVPALWGRFQTTCSCHVRCSECLLMKEAEDAPILMALI